VNGGRRRPGKAAQHDIGDDGLGPDRGVGPPETTSIPAVKHNGTKRAACNHGYGPVAEPTNAENPIEPASTIARPMGRSGEPTSDTTAIRLAPIAMATAARVSPRAMPTAKTTATGSAVIAAESGESRSRSTRNVLRSTDHPALTERGPACVVTAQS
jgi:hypothetical protein